MRTPRPLALACLTLLAASPLLAQRQYRLELGAGGAYNVFDRKTDLKGAVGGFARIGYWVAGPLSLELEGTFARPTTDTPLKETVKVSTVGAWALANFPIGATGGTHLFL